MIWKLIYHIKNFATELEKDHVSAYAAQTAYFIMLSFIPFIMLLLTLVKFTPVQKSILLDAAVRICPDSIDPIVINIIDEVYAKSVAVISITAIAAAWSAGKGLLAITRGLNTVYEVSESRNYIVLRLRSVAYTIIVIVVIVLALVLLVFGNTIHKFLELNYPLIAKISGFIINIRTLLAFAVLSMFFTILYKFIPNRKASLKTQLPGAVFTAIVWSAFSFAFSIYVDYSNGFTNMYGSLTGIILAMLWLYACMYIMLIGAEINSYFEEGFRKLLDR